MYLEGIQKKRKLGLECSVKKRKGNGKGRRVSKIREKQNERQREESSNKDYNR